MKIAIQTVHLTSLPQEAKSLPGVGDKLADKIWEIIESGELRKLDELSSQEEIQVNSQVSM